jgi:carboxyl-terminal processing protease
MLFLAGAITSAVIAIPSWATIKATGDEALAPLPIHVTTTKNIVDALSSRHYVPTALNDELSARIFDTYIGDLDPSRSYFLQSDIDEFEQYRYKMDDALKRGNLSPAFDIFNRYHEKLITRFEKIIVTLDEDLNRFDFTVPEELLIAREETPWARTEKQLDDLWRKRLKDSVLNLKLTDKEPKKNKGAIAKKVFKSADTFPTN